MRYLLLLIFFILFISCSESEDFSISQESEDLSSFLKCEDTQTKEVSLLVRAKERKYNIDYDIFEEKDFFYEYRYSFAITNKERKFGTLDSETRWELDHGTRTIKIDKYKNKHPIFWYIKLLQEEPEQLATNGIYKTSLNKLEHYRYLPRYLVKKKADDIEGIYIPVSLANSDYMEEADTKEEFKRFNQIYRSGFLTQSQYVLNRMNLSFVTKWIGDGNNYEYPKPDWFNEFNGTCEIIEKVKFLEIAQSKLDETFDEVLPILQKAEEAYEKEIELEIELKSRQKI